MHSVFVAVYKYSALLPLLDRMPTSHLRSNLISSVSCVYRRYGCLPAPISVSISIDNLDACHKRNMTTTNGFATPPLTPGLGSGAGAGAAAAAGAAKGSLAGVREDVGGQRNLDKLRAISRDLRSESLVARRYLPTYSDERLTPADTITIPSDEMLLASLSASRGDSVYFEDEDTTALERRIAALTGKEDCLFAVSGTMTNRKLSLAWSVLPTLLVGGSPPDRPMATFPLSRWTAEAWGIGQYSSQNSPSGPTSPAPRTPSSQTIERTSTKTKEAA